MEVEVIQTVAVANQRPCREQGCTLRGHACEAQVCPLSPRNSRSQRRTFTVVSSNMTQEALFTLNAKQ